MGMVLDIGGGGSDMDLAVLDIVEKDIKKLKIGQYVEIRICGTIGMLDVSPSGDQPSVGLKVDTREVTVLSSDQEKGIRSLADDSTDENDSSDYSEN